MAKTIAPLMSTSASGRFGGLEYKRSLAGNIVGRKSTSTPSSSPANQESRVTLGRLAHRWGQMDESDRLLWAAAATGHLTGYSLFIQRSYWVYRSTGQPALDPHWIPVPLPPTAADAIWITGDPSSLFVSTDPWPPAGPLAILETQPMRYQSARPDPSHWSCVYLGPAILLPNPIDFPSYVPPQAVRLRIIDIVSGLTLAALRPAVQVI